MHMQLKICAPILLLFFLADFGIDQVKIVSKTQSMLCILHLRAASAAESSTQTSGKFRDNISAKKACFTKNMPFSGKYCLMTTLTLMLTLNDPHDTSSNPKRVKSTPTTRI